MPLHPHTRTERHYCSLWFPWFFGTTKAWSASVRVKRSFPRKWGWSDAWKLPPSEKAGQTLNSLVGHFKVWAVKEKNTGSLYNENMSKQRRDELCLDVDAPTSPCWQLKCWLQCKKINRCAPWQAEPIGGGVHCLWLLLLMSDLLWTTRHTEVNSVITLMTGCTHWDSIWPTVLLLIVRYFSSLEMKTVSDSSH